MSQAAYNPHEAVAMAYESLPEPLRTLLNRDDVFRMLHLEFQYYDTAARHTAGKPHAPTSLDLELLVAFISGEALKAGYCYTTEQIAHVLKGEDLYLKQIGLIAP